MANHVKALHCNGTKIPFTGLSRAREHSRGFEDATFFTHSGGHEVRKNVCPPIREFLLQVQWHREKMGRACPKVETDLD